MVTSKVTLSNGDFKVSAQHGNFKVTLSNCKISTLVKIQKFKLISKLPINIGLLPVNLNYHKRGSALTWIERELYAFGIGFVPLIVWAFRSFGKYSEWIVCIFFSLTFSYRSKNLRK